MQSCSRTRQKLSWSDLPEQALNSIVKFIGNDVDNLRHFRSVCKNWRQSAAYSIPPSLILGKNLLFSSVLLLRLSDSTTTPWMVTAVEIANGFTMFFHPFYGTPLINVSPDLKISKFHDSLLSSARHTADFLFVHNLSALFAPEKLLRFKFKNHLVKEVDYCDHDTDDVVTFSNLLAYTLGSNGNLYQVSVNVPSNCLVTKKFAIRALNENDDDGISYRKRMVRHSATLKLYLVVRRKNQMFKVYQFSRKDRTTDVWDRIEVHKFGDTHKARWVLFVTRDTGFFASAKKFKGCQLRNCIVFSHDAFPPYSKADLELPRDGGGIYVYQLGGTNNAFVPISSYPGFPCHLWSPPPWVLQGSLSQSHSEPEKDQTDQVKKPVQSCQDLVISLQEHKQHDCAATSGPIHEKQSVEFRSVDGAKATRNISINALKHVTEEGPHQETLRNGIIHREPVKDKKDQEKQLVHSCQDGVSSQEETQSGCSPSVGPMSEKQTIEIHPADGEKATGSTAIHSVSRAYITFIDQSNSSGVSTIKFEGVDIRSSLVTILQKIWSKHGNIIENCLMRNGDIIAKALESLATLVLILEGNTVQSLSDHQADYLSSTLSDLRCMCFKVDWLVPFVEKAVGLHKGKTLIDSFNKLSQLNDQATERRSTLLDELAKVEEMQKELKEDLANLSKKIPFVGEIDLNFHLGGGLI